MTTTRLQGIALLAMIASLPLLSWGTSDDIAAITITGGVLLLIGMAALTVLRYVTTKEET